MNSGSKLFLEALIKSSFKVYDCECPDATGGRCAH